MLRLLFGICRGCATRFWWTGEKDNCPACGTCGRIPNRYDWDAGKTRDERESVA